jgi:PA14 domain
MTFFGKFRRTGLNGHYFYGSSFNKSAFKRIDGKIDFNWNEGSPINKKNRDNFSVRWEGFLWVPANDTIEFLVRSDDGARLWVDNQFLIVNWTSHAPANEKTTIFLYQGYHHIRLEYFESKKGAQIQLFWRPSKSDNFSIIPSINLLPSKRYMKKNEKIFPGDA